MAAGARVSSLLGRRLECQSLDQVVASLRAGQSKALVIRAEAGVGKTALLDYLSTHANGCHVVHAVGVESEIELAYAGLHQVCAPLLDRLGELPAPQGTALSVALGLRLGPAPDRFLVGLAVLSLFSAAAAEAPLLCLVDDVQWFDLVSRQTVAFVARRLVAESVGLVFAVREPSDDTVFAGVDDLVVEGLEDDDARLLLDRVMTGPIDPAVRDRLVAETHGNPLAISELSRGTGPADIAGEYGTSPSRSIGNRIEDSFLRRIRALPDATQHILIVAAVEPVGDQSLVVSAAALLGLEPMAFTPAISEGMLEVGVRVRFRHPLIRSAAIRAATPEGLQRAHRALADVTDPDIDPDRRAWHHAEAVVGFDEDVAAELVRSARRAQARGGLAAGAAFHQRAVELTPDLATRSRRALMAAEDKYRAGAMNDALALLEQADTRHLDDHQRARAELVRARVSHAVTRGRDAPRLLLRAARRLQPHDPEASLAIYADAFIAALSSGDQAVGKDIHDVAASILAADAPEPLGAASAAARDALHGLALLVTEGYPTAAPVLRAALLDLTNSVTTPSTSTDSPKPGSAGAAAAAHRELRRGLGADATANDAGLRWLGLGCLVARTLSDDVADDRLTDLYVRGCRSSGALSLLPVAVAERAAVLLWSGRMPAARVLADAVRPVIQATDAPETMDRSLWLSSFTGDEPGALPAIQSPSRAAISRGEGQWLISVGWGSGMLFNALGRYEDAFAATTAVAGHPFDIGMAAWLLPERVEAGVRTGNIADAQASANRLTEIAETSGTDWALGVAARSAALLADADAAEKLYLEAIALLDRTMITAASARAHLVFGEWLRRANRRVEAREQLRTAYDMLIRMGMNGFAERARRELFATGETVHRAGDDSPDDLTSQERQIALLAAGGATNPEIGAQLYLSPRTVEWHLRKVFTKLGVSSRRQLSGALRTGSATRAS